MVDYSCAGEFVEGESDVDLVNNRKQTVAEGESSSVSSSSTSMNDDTSNKDTSKKRSHSDVLDDPTATADMDGTSNTSLFNSFILLSNDSKSHF